jgi:threonine synthase
MIVAPSEDCAKLTRVVKSLKLDIIIQDVAEIYKPADQNIFLPEPDEKREIWESLKKVSKLGFYIEPTSAVATAGLSQLITKKIIKPKDSTVVILTGFGLKATDKIGILKG